MLVNWKMNDRLLIGPSVFLYVSLQFGLYEFKKGALMSDRKRILIIDDDEMLASMLCEQLSGLEGYDCEVVHNGQAGLDRVADGYFDVIILDVEMPDMNGHEVCRELRARDVMTPIVMLTVQDSDQATISGFEAGATDYVTKPFKLGVLLARIRAHIRQFEYSDDAQLHIGAFIFCPSAKILLNQDTSAVNVKIRLTDKEAQILKFLYRHGDRVVGREELLGEVWGYNAGVTTHTLETHVYRLRQKMERDPSKAEILITEPGGYRLVS